MSEAIDISTTQRKALLVLLRRFIPGVEVWAYGSRAKWTARPNSDLDLVAFTSPEQSQNISGLKDALAESNLPFLVDLHVWSEVPERFHEIIRKEYVVFQEAAEEKQNDAWEKVPLGELTINLDSIRIPVRGSERKSGPYPYYGASGIVDYIDKYLFDGEYLLISEDGENLRTRQTPIAFLAKGKFWVNNHAHVVQGNERASTRFLSYALAATDVSGYLSGSTMPKLTQGNLNRIPVTAPSIEEQKRIAHILGTLDDKIELNRRINTTLEAMARALYQSWFVNFDPVRRNAEGGEFRPEDVLFPDSFKDSAVGDIPLGWTVERVGDVVDCVGGGTPSTKEPMFWDDGVHHWTTPKDFSSLQSPILIDTSRKLTKAGIAKISSGLLPAGTLLLSSRAPVGYLAISAIPVAINQGFIAMKCNDRASNYFMLNWCQTNMAEIKNRATGTTFPEISKNSFRPISVILPPKALMAEYTAKVAPLYAQVTANLNQSRTLAKLRDTLLPSLLSGHEYFACGS